MSTNIVDTAYRAEVFFHFDTSYALIEDCSFKSATGQCFQGCWQHMGALVDIWKKGLVHSIPLVSQKIKA